MESPGFNLQFFQDRKEEKKSEREEGGKERKRERERKRSLYFRCALLCQLAEPPDSGAPSVVLGPHPCPGQTGRASAPSRLSVGEAADPRGEFSALLPVPVSFIQQAEPHAVWATHFILRSRTLRMDSASLTALSVRFCSCFL